MRRAWKYIWHRVTRISASAHDIALGLAVGVFMGFSPLVGFHILISAIICFFIGGNVLAAAIGTMVCNPIMCPLMLFGGFQLGKFILGSREEFTAVHLEEGSLSQLFTDPAGFWHVFWGALEPVFLPLFIGGALLGLSVALPAYFIARRAVITIRNERARRRRRK